MKKNQVSMKVTPETVDMLVMSKHQLWDYMARQSEMDLTTDEQFIERSTVWNEEDHLWDCSLTWFTAEELPLFVKPDKEVEDGTSSANEGDLSATAP